MQNMTHHWCPLELLLCIVPPQDKSSLLERRTAAIPPQERKTRLQETKENRRLDYMCFHCRIVRGGSVAIIIMMMMMIMASSPTSCLTRSLVPASAIAVSRLSSSAPCGCSSSFSCSSVSSSVISISTVFQLIRRKTSCSIVISGCSRRRRRRNSVTRPGRPGFEASGVRRKTKVRAIVDERESDIAAAATNRGGLQGMKFPILFF